MKPQIQQKPRNPNPTYAEHLRELVILPFAIATFIGFLLLLEWGLRW